MPILRSFVAGFTLSAILLASEMPTFAWSNRGHRMINLVAEQALPDDMPAFVRTAEAAREISYLGPEPDRWTQLGLEPELASATGSDHFMRLELAEAVGPLPRKRYDFLRKLDELRNQHPDDAANLTPQRIGTLPWEAEEIFERLEAAFHTYRIAMGEYPPGDYSSWAPRLHTVVRRALSMPGVDSLLALSCSVPPRPTGHASTQKFRDW